MSQKQSNPMTEMKTGSGIGKMIGSATTGGSGGGMKKYLPSKNKQTFKPSTKPKGLHFGHAGVSFVKKPKTK